MTKSIFKDTPKFGRNKSCIKMKTNDTKSQNEERRLFKLDES